MNLKCCVAHQCICGDCPLGRKIKLLRRGLRQALGRSGRFIMAFRGGLPAKAIIGSRPLPIRIGFSVRSEGIQCHESEKTKNDPASTCMIVELIDNFFAEYPATTGSDKVDTDEADEVIDAIAKTVAELTSQQDGLIRQQVIEHLMRQIMQYDAEFRREEATSTVTSNAKH